MFVRFRKTKHELQVSLCETRWVDGRVRQEHIAQFGSVEVPQSVEERIAFWKRLHERLARLSNRIDANALGKILGDIHTRIPMVTLDEQRQLKIEHAEANERFWYGHRDYLQGTVADHEGLAAKTERVIAEGKAQVADADAKVASARDAADRLRKGEDVAVGRPPTREDFERILGEAGMTAADVRHCELLASLPEDVMPTIRDAALEASKRAERAVTRKLVRAARRGVVG